MIRIEVDIKLIYDFFLSLKKEGFLQAIERTINYIRFGKGILKSQKLNNRKNERGDLCDAIRRISFASQPLLNIQSKQPVDIIIPIYKGFEYLETLASSLDSGTTFPFRLIFIDDCSEDERVSHFLNNLDVQNKNLREVVVRRNKKNIGFVKSVNVGLRLSKNHVVILNTDVEVPAGWLERLIYPFYKYRNIASVTPFTNAGEICSFPRFLENNPMIEGMQVNEIDQYFKYIIPHRNFVELPTGVGFCMAMNREAIDKVGIFDEEKFGRGYGEENDWCQRAIKKGFKNLIAPNLFVYHKHGASFSSGEKKKLQEENLKKLIGRHKQYLNDVSTFIANDPLKGIRDIILLLLLSNFQPDNKPILFLDHQLGGGANYYSRDYVDKCVKSDKKIFYLTYDKDKGIYKLDFFFKDYKISYFFCHFSEIEALFSVLKIGEIIVSEIVSYKYPLGVLDIIQRISEKYRVPIQFLVHDYFCLCPKYDLLGYEGRFCELPREDKCAECLSKNRKQITQIIGDSEKMEIKRWRKRWENFFRSVDKIICFSESSRDLILKVYPNVLAKITIRPHRVDYLDDNISREFLVGVLGSVNEAKGIKIIKEIAELAKKRGEPIKIIILGEVSEDIENKDEDIIVHGKYQRENLKRIVQGYGIDVFLVASIIPETFSYTTEEIITMKYPVACFDLGAQAEKVLRYKKGMVIPKISAEDALDTLLKLGLKFTSKLS